MSLFEAKGYFVNLSDKCVAQIGIDLIEEIRKIHSKGYIHRDIKPDNILTNYQLINDFRIYSSDFLAQFEKI